MTKITDETRTKAVAMYAETKNLRETALHFVVSYESVRQWVRQAAWVAAEAANAAASQAWEKKVRSGPRKPVYLADGVRLGRAALWT